MAPIKFLDLPRDCLEQVVEHLVCEYDRSDLKALTLTCHALRKLSMPYLFRYIDLASSYGAPVFRRNVACLIWLLWQYDAFQFVRKIDFSYHITGPFGPDRPDSSKIDWECRLDQFYGSKTQNVFRSDEQDIIVCGRESGLLVLTELVRQVRGLRDLVLIHHIPKVLLEVLHLKHPKCRLHISEFMLEDYYSPTLNDLALVTSPCLYSIYCSYNKTRRPLDKVVMNISAGIAPSLRKVRMWHSNTRERFGAEEPDGEDQVEPLGVYNYFKILGLGRSLGRLKSLDLICADNPPYQIHEWSKFTDLAVLEELRFYSNPLVSDINWYETIGNFPCLKRLTLDLQFWKSEISMEGHKENAALFLSRLPPLELLYLSGYIWPEVVAPFIQVHGKSLRSLMLRPLSEGSLGQRTQFRKYASLPTHQIVDILSQCPELEILDIPVERTYWNAHDPIIYQEMGALKHLKRIILRLDCLSGFEDPDIFTTAKNYFTRPNFIPSDNSSNIIEKMKQAMRACAISSGLVRDIIDLITRKRVTHPLQELSIGSLTDSDKINIAYGRNMAEIFDTLCGGHAYEKQPDGSFAEDEECASERDTSYGNVEENCWQMGIFREIWPAKPGSKNYSEDWDSISLSLT